MALFGLLYLGMASAAQLTVLVQPAFGTNDGTSKLTARKMTVNAPAHFMVSDEGIVHKDDMFYDMKIVLDKSLPTSIALNGKGFEIKNRYPEKEVLFQTDEGFYMYRPLDKKKHIYLVCSALSMEKGNAAKAQTKALIQACRSMK